MKETFRLQGLGCANCASKMERAIAKLDGIENVSVNFMTTKMIIECDEDKMNEIIKEAENIIKKIESNVVVKKL